MKNFFKISFLFLLSLAQTVIFAIEKEEIQQQQPFPFLELSGELNTEIFKSFINDLFKTPRDFNNLKAKILDIRLISSSFNCFLDNFFTEDFIEKLSQAINENSAYPISPYQLAKILLNNEKLKEFERSHKDAANELSKKIYSAILQYACIRLISPPINELFEEIKTLIKSGANLDITIDEPTARKLVITMTQGFRAAEIDELVNIFVNAGANLEYENHLMKIITGKR